MAESDAGSGGPPAEEGAPAEGADSPSSDEATSSKSKISIPGLLALALMITGAALTVTACISLPWRIGAGSSSSLYAGLLGPDFKQREYYMYYVKGVTKRSWHDLTVLTCDKAAKVEITIGKSDDGICDTDLSAQLPEKCSKKFLPHVKDRCHVYNFVAAINAAFCTLTFVYAGAGIIVGALGAAPILNAAKKFYLPIGLSLCFGSVAQLGAWMYFTDEKFTFIGRSAEFPYPGVANGFWVHLAGSLAYGVAAFFYIGPWKDDVADAGGDEKKDDEEKKEGEENDEEKKSVEAEPI